MEKGCRDDSTVTTKATRLKHDDVIKWKHFPRYWPFVRGIHRSPVNSQHKGQRRGALMFSLICARINGWVNKGEAGDLRRHGVNYDVIVMERSWISCAISRILRQHWVLSLGVKSHPLPMNQTSLYLYLLYMNSLLAATRWIGCVTWLTRNRSHSPISMVADDPAPIMPKDICIHPGMIPNWSMAHRSILITGIKFIT